MSDELITLLGWSWHIGKGCQQGIIQELGQDACLGIHQLSDSQHIHTHTHTNISTYNK